MKSGPSAGGRRSALLRRYGHLCYVVQLLLLSVGDCVGRPSFVPKLFRRGGSISVDDAAVFNTVPASWLVALPQKEEYTEYSHDQKVYATIEEITTASSLVEENHFQPPSINISEMALALRWTSEINRRLEVGTQGITEGRHQRFLTPGVNLVRGGGGAVMTTTYRILKTVEQQNDDDATIFHAKTPRLRSTGVARWGPCLEKFIQRLFDILQEDYHLIDPHLELTLAMMYLDRACSVEKVRSVAQLPFCTPRTVHRLSLTAILVAVAAVRGVSDMTPIYDKVETTFGIPSANCQSMVEWMRAAFGDAGIFVTPDEMREWKLRWEARFAPCA